MERVEIIEKMLALNTGRPPIKRINVVEYLMSNPAGVSVKSASSRLGISPSTIEDTFRCLIKFDYLDKLLKDKDEYKEERYILKGKSDVHRLPYIYRLSKKFYDCFDSCRTDITDEARGRLEDKIVLSRELSVGIRANVAALWVGIWDTSFGRLEIKEGHPIKGEYPNGTIKGEAKGGTLSGSWSECAESGIFEFTMNPGSGSFSGKRGSNIHQPTGEWNGILIRS